MPRSELDALRSSEDWPSIVADAPASVEDIRAVARHRFDPEHFRAMAMPVLLQVGSESPAGYYVTDALAAVLPDAAVETLAGQAHDAMITAPPEYADAVRRFLLPEQ
jgi:pimeloyl-ACP methyl ester carboxylesterase